MTDIQCVCVREREESYRETGVIKQRERKRKEKKRQMGKQVRGVVHTDKVTERNRNRGRKKMQT